MLNKGQPRYLPLATLLWTCRFWVVMVLATIPVALLALACTPFDREGDLAHRFARWWAMGACWGGGGKVTIRGLEHLQGDRAQVLVANHQSYFDIFALTSRLPIQFRWLAKGSLFRVPLLGWAMRRAGYLSIERSNRRQAYRSLMQAIERLKGGRSVILFPEGGRSFDGILQPFRRGGLVAALRAGVPLVPITIEGSNRVMGADRWIRPGRIQVIIGQPIQASGKGREEEERLLERIREEISTTLEGLRQVADRKSRW